MIWYVFWSTVVPVVTLAIGLGLVVKNRVPRHPDDLARVRYARQEHIAAMEQAMGIEPSTRYLDPPRQRGFGSSAKEVAETWTLAAIALEEEQKKRRQELDPQIQRIYNAIHGIEEGPPS